MCYLHQPLQLVELAVEIFKVVLVESSQAVFIHDFHQHTEGLFLRHLKQTHRQLVSLCLEHFSTFVGHKGSKTRNRFTLYLHVSYSWAL